MPGAPTARRLLQTIGTEWGRGCVHPDLWTCIAMCDVGLALREGADIIVFDDVRFEEEAQAIRDSGGVVVHVFRTDEARARAEAKSGRLVGRWRWMWRLWYAARRSGQHASEVGLLCRHGDIMCTNKCPLEELEGNVAQLLIHVLAAARLRAMHTRG